ncbi:hypothetical protein BKA70DRAFT_1240986 [Coprinopsis sp. MPI-PUGE-AT-0042]|nr:hypothetical protein BKA70DRAFT_1240986 [Coprinopsis sp. MPI-PUGE-AT-0042]
MSGPSNLPLGFRHLPAMSVPQLPLEIIALIVDHVAFAGKGPWKGLNRDLKACSLTSKLLLTLTRPYLFASMSLSAKRAQSRKFNTELDCFPIARYVKTLRLTYANGDALQGGLDALAAIILALRDLRSFCFHFKTNSSSEWYTLPSLLRHEIQKLIMRSPKLTRFETDMVAFPLWRLITTDLHQLILRPPFATIAQYHSLSPIGREHCPEQVIRLKYLELSNYYAVTLSEILYEPGWITLTQLETLVVVINSGYQYFLVQELLSQSQALKEVKMALHCDAEEEELYHSMYPIPLESFHSSSFNTLKQLHLELYIRMAEHIPETLDAQYLGLTSTDPTDPLGLPTLLSFSSLTSLKLCIYLYGDLVAVDSWRELDTLFIHPDVLPDLRELTLDVVIYPLVDRPLGGNENVLEEAQLLFEDLDPWFFNSRNGCFRNIWKRAKNQVQGNFTFRPSVRVTEEVEVIPFRTFGL